MLTEKSPKGISEHFPDVPGRELRRIHGKRYAWPNFGLRFSLNDVVASL